MKKFMTALLSAIMMVSLAACGNSSTGEKKKIITEGTKQEQTKDDTKKIKEGGDLVFSAGSDPTSLSPFFQQNRITYTINNALYDPVYVFDGKEMRYYLAESIEASPDMLTYTMKLKNNLKWHDGKKITADDIVFSVKAALDKKQNIEARGSFVINDKDVQVSKKDDLTVEFKLPEVYVPFKVNLSDFKPIPKHVFDGVADLSKSPKNNTPVGSGPYKFKEWKKGESIVLERFNDYYAGKPHIDKIIYRIIGDSNAASVAFQNGEISANYINDQAKFVKYASDSKYKTYIYEEGMLSYLIYNMQNPNLAKKEVRQAISYALNKEDIIKGDGGTLENTQLASSVFPPSTMYYTDKVQKYDNNIEKAKELLKKAGTSKIKLKFNYEGSQDGDKKIALVVQQQLKEIGIDVELVALETQAYYDKLVGEQKRDYDLILNGYVMGIEPNAYSNVYASKAPFNCSVYENKNLDKMWKDAAVEKDEAKRKGMYEKIQQTIASDAPIFPIQYSQSKVVTTAKLGGVKEAKTVPIYMFEDLSKLYFTE